MFIFSLARELHMTVARLLSELDAHELAEWKAYFRIESEKYEKPKDEGKQVYGVDKQGAAMLRAAFAHKVKKG